MFVVAPDTIEPCAFDPNSNSYISKENMDEIEAFKNCDRLSGPKYITPYSRSAVSAAHKLEYWSQQTHDLIQPFRRKWIKFVLLVFKRLRLPSVVQLMILKMLKRHELGPLVST